MFSYKENKEGCIIDPSCSSISEKDRSIATNFKEGDQNVFLNKFMPPKITI